MGQRAARDFSSHDRNVGSADQPATYLRPDSTFFDAVDGPYSPKVLIRMQLMARPSKTTPGCVTNRMSHFSDVFPWRSIVKHKAVCFVVDEDVPHVEVLGLETLANEPPILKLRGDENAYVVDPTMLDPMLSLSDTDGGVATTRMTDLLSAPPTWAEEKSPRWTVWWSSIRLADIPRDRLSPTHYRQDGAVFSGFDEDSLPQMPFEPYEDPSLDTPLIDSPGGNRAEIYEDF